MAINEKINDDIKVAMKSGDSLKLLVLRGLTASFNNKMIELRSSGKEMGEDDYLQVISSEAKKRRDSIIAFNAGGRSDLVGKEEAELMVLAQYLPEQMSSQEVGKIVDEVLATNPEAKENMGLAMKLVMARVGKSADGGLVSGIIRGKING